MKKIVNVYVNFNGKLTRLHYLFGFKSIVGNRTQKTVNLIKFLAIFAYFSLSFVTMGVALTLFFFSWLMEIICFAYAPYHNLTKLSVSCLQKCIHAKVNLTNLWMKSLHCSLIRLETAKILQTSCK